MVMLFGSEPMGLAGKTKNLIVEKWPFILDTGRSPAERMEIGDRI
jgi:hypothetical protein